VESSLLLLWAWAEFNLSLSLQMRELDHAFHGPVLYSDFTTSNCPSNSTRVEERDLTEIVGKYILPFN
jgi:hypothetical protein